MYFTCFHHDWALLSELPRQGVGQAIWGIIQALFHVNASISLMKWFKKNEESSFPVGLSAEHLRVDFIYLYIVRILILFSLLYLQNTLSRVF